MTGAEHFKEAERLLGEALADVVVAHSQGIEMMNTLLARAQVHATLALAAATAWSGGPNGTRDEIVPVEVGSPEHRAGNRPRRVASGYGAETS